MPNNKIPLCPICNKAQTYAEWKIENGVKKLIYRGACKEHLDRFYLQRDLTKKKKIANGH